MQLRIKKIGFRNAHAGSHRVDVSAKSVDLTVASKVIEEGCLTPNWERVREEGTLHEHHSHDSDACEKRLSRKSNFS